MSYGFQVTNTSGKVLVDSELFHYHWLGKFTHYDKTSVPDMLYGPGNQSYGPNDNKNMNNMPNVGRIYKFSIPSNGNKPPMCFIKPSSVSSSAPYQGIVLTQKDGTSWDIWVFSSKDHSTAPVLYCFSPINQINHYDAYGSAMTGTTYGLTTYNTDQQKTFDSRFKPLRVISGGEIDSPTAAHTGSSGYGLTVNLSINTTEKTERVSSADSVASNDIIYYSPSIGHACHQYEWQGADSGVHDWKNYAWARTDLWWIFTRVGYRVYKSSGKMYFKSHHGVYARGHVWDHDSTSSSIIGAILGGLLTGGAYFAVALGAIAAGGAFTGSAVAEGGYLPYANGSRNTGDVSFLFSRASYYD